MSPLQAKLGHYTFTVYALSHPYKTGEQLKAPLLASLALGANKLVEVIFDTFVSSDRSSYSDSVLL